MNAKASRAHKYLTATGLPFVVDELPPLEAKAPPGLSFQCEDEPDLFYREGRWWWSFRRGFIDHEQLIPDYNTGIAWSDWPLKLPIKVLLLRMFQWQDILEGVSPFYDPLDTASKQLLNDWMSRSLLLLELTIGGRMELNTRAVRKPAAQALASYAWRISHAKRWRGRGVAALFT